MEISLLFGADKIATRRQRRLQQVHAQIPPKSASDEFVSPGMQRRNCGGEAGFCEL
jgi:hypothetical protein